MLVIKLEVFMSTTSIVSRYTTQLYDFFLPRNAVTGKREVHFLSPHFVQPFLKLFDWQSETPYVSQKEYTFTNSDGQRETKTMNALIKSIGAHLDAQFPQNCGLSCVFHITEAQEIAVTDPQGNIRLGKQFVESVLDLYNKGDQRSEKGENQMEKLGLSDFEPKFQALSPEDIIAAEIAHEIIHLKANDFLGSFELAASGNVFNASIVWRALSTILGKETFKVKLKSLAISFIAFCVFNVLWGTLFTSALRKNETRADIYGMELLAKAGYKPEAMVRLMFSSTLAPIPESEKGVFATHPHPEERVRNCHAALPRLSNAPGSETHPEGPIRIYAIEKKIERMTKLLFSVAN